MKRGEAENLWLYDAFRELESLRACELSLALSMRFHFSSRSVKKEKKRGSNLGRADEKLSFSLGAVVNVAANCCRSLIYTN